MKITRLWANISSLSPIVLMVASLGLTVALPAGAQTPSPWEYPGTYPYLDTPEKAAVMHEATSGLPKEEFMRGASMFYSSSGECEEYYIQDGDLLWNTFTKNKFSKSIYTIAAMKYSKAHEKAGQSLPGDHENRRAMRCDLGRTDGAHVVYPFACSNWSVAYFEPTKPKVDSSEPPPADDQITKTDPSTAPSVLFETCRFVAVRETVEPGFVTYVAAIGGHNGFAPAVFSIIPASTSKQSSLVCE